MSTEIEGLIDFRKLHEGIVKEIERSPSETASGSQIAPEGQMKPKGSELLGDIAPFLARVERVAQVLQQSTNYAREMELAVHDLNERQIELDADLNQAACRIKELEQALAGERGRATRAQVIAAQANQRVQTVERALAEANARADALMSAIENAFPDVEDAATSESMAAA